ncbi:hypothetical protein ACFXC8_19700 [Streptomyces sp. NPDC059441]|uniref:hypothetical protein n=1 Tax=Streptomyces sp. NPDC059441 TaxID=3346829 RepID=UPI003688EEC3
MSEEAAAYARKLEEVFGRAANRRKELAEFVPCSPSVVTRYFNGERVAPKDFLTRFRAFLDSRGVAVDNEEFAELDGLRRVAQEASGAYSAQVAYFRERIEELEQQLASQTEKQPPTHLEEELSEIVTDLDEAYQQAKTAESERGVADQAQESAVGQGEDADQLAQIGEVLQELRQQVADLKQTQSERVVIYSHTADPPDVATGTYHQPPARAGDGRGCLLTLGALLSWFCGVGLVMVPLACASDLARNRPWPVAALCWTAAAILSVGLFMTYLHLSRREARKRFPEPQPWYNVPPYFVWLCAGVVSPALATVNFWLFPASFVFGGVWRFGLLPSGWNRR